MPYLFTLETWIFSLHSFEQIFFWDALWILVLQRENSPLVKSSSTFIKALGNDCIYLLHTTQILYLANTLLLE